MGKCELKS